MELNTQVFLVTALISNVFSTIYPEHPKSNVNPLANSIDLLSLQFLKEAYTSSEDTNIVASPLGVNTLVAMYGAGTSGKTREELVTFFGANSYSELSESYGSLSTNFSKLDSNYFTLANKIYVSNKFTLRDDFRNTVLDTFHGEVETISFDKPKVAVDTINLWAKEKTKGHLSKVLSDGSLDENTAVALFNVIFFQGEWTHKFDPARTKDEDFHVDRTRTVKKPFMVLRKSLLYHESTELNAKMIELPYKEKSFRMVVILPNEVDGLPNVLQKAAESGLLQHVSALRYPKFETILHFPKFKIETEFDLQQILSKMGLTRIFSDTADVLVNEQPLAVSKAFHKAFVVVDEEGATAGAVTEIDAVPISEQIFLSGPVTIKVDHPFFFLILQGNHILFIGTYTH